METAALLCMLGMAFPKAAAMAQVRNTLVQGQPGDGAACGVEGCMRGVSPCPHDYLWHLALCTLCV